MKVAIILSAINRAGGTERVGITAIEALNEIDIVPDIFPLDIGTEENVFGKDIKYNLKTINYINPPRFTIYSYYANRLLNFNKFKNYDYTFNFSLIFFNFKKGLYYIHVPDFDVKMMRPGYNKGWRKFYVLPIELIIDPIQKRAFLNTKSMDRACNSKYIADILCKQTGMKSRVIYPPIDLESFKSNDKKRDGVVTIGRFTPIKNQLEQIEIAQKNPDITFRLLGTGSEKKKYFQKLAKEAEKLENIELHVNLPIDKFIDIVKSSKFFMHNMRNEHFGIATVEAIAAGCIPIVHNSGGQKEIVPYPELRFNEKEEAIQILKRLQNENLDRYRNRLQQYIKRFDEKVFKNKIRKYLLWETQG